MTFTAAVSFRVLVALSVVASLACEKKLVGRKIAGGIAQRLSVQKNAVAFLLNAEHPDDPGVPQDLFLGDLYAGPLDHEAHRIGSAVPSQPGSFAFSTDGNVVAYLARYRFRDGAGELWASRMGPGVPEQVAREVHTFAWSPVAGALAYVAPDTLGVRGAYELHLPGVQSIVWSADGKFIAARASAASGGALWLLDALHGKVRQVSTGTSDFAFGPDAVLAYLGPPGPKGGDRPLFLDGQQIAEATAFQFSPDGKQIALFSTSKQPGEATGDLYRMPTSSVGTPVLVASRVSDWRWSSTGELLCLARYDLRARAGTLTVASDGAPAAAPDAGSAAPDAGPAATPSRSSRELAGKVQSFTAFGRRVLFLVQAPQKGDYKLELWSVDLGTATPPRKVDEGVYGWDLIGRNLLYKARCAGGPRACSLLRVPFDGSAAPEMVAADVAGFDVSGDGSRVLVEQPHHGSTKAVDLVVVPVTNVQTSRLKVVIEEADPSARFADDAGKQVVYATLASGKQGVYVADVP